MRVYRKLTAEFGEMFYDREEAPASPAAEDPAGEAAPGER